MKRTVGVMTVAVMLCAQTGAYAADQMSKEGESSKQSSQSGQSGQAGQDMQRQSGQTSPSGQSGKAGQDVRQQQSGQSGNFSEEMQRQNAQIWESGKQAQGLCQKPAQAKQASAQPDQAKPASSQPAQAGQDQPKQQAQASKDQSQPIPEQSKQPQGQAGRDQDKQSVQDQGRASGATQTINGQFVRMENDFYIVKDQSGKETCVPTSYGTFVDQTFSPGDTIAARLGQDGTALVIGRPSDRQPTSSSDFAASQQGSQSPDSGARDQSMKSADKGVSGSQQPAPVLKGELLKIQGEFYTVKDQSGSEVRLHVNKETKMESAVSVGDKIEAERTTSDHAISIKKAQDTGGSRNR